MPIHSEPQVNKGDAPDDGPGPTGPMATRDAAPAWPLYVRAALGLAITAGFGLGAALFAAAATGAATGRWWAAAAEAHGHVQLFGWAGLMVLGTGLHFLPRLRGAPRGDQRPARLACLLLATGLALRALSQPLAALTGPGGSLARAGLIGSGALELTGACLVLAILAGTLRRGPPLRDRTGLWPVLPFFALAFAAYWSALALNLLGLARDDVAFPPEWADRSVELLAMYGFLLPVAVAMSARTFPLFYRTPLPRMPLLHAGLATLLAGLALRLYGDLAGDDRVAGLGALALAAACLLFIHALGIVAPRRPLPRQPVRQLRDPFGLHAIGAYCWLALVAALLCLRGLRALGAPLGPIGADAEVHAFGAGFITLLILGVGAQLLPGFAQRRLRARGLVWATLALGNGAALLRLVPLLFPALFPSDGSAVLSLAGIAALFALIVFSINVPTAPRH